MSRAELLAQTPEEFLTVAETARRLKIAAVKTLRNQMHNGTWVRGVHWFKRRGIGPRFSWRAVVLALWEASQPTPPSAPQSRPDARHRPQRGVEYRAEQM